NPLTHLDAPFAFNRSNSGRHCAFGNTVGGLGTCCAGPRGADRLGMGRTTMRSFLRILIVLPAFATGCEATKGVRYVYQERDFGVVALPENTNCWPAHYRRQAEKLMAAHFPEGHEVVRAEEVVEGSRTLKIEGSKTAELAPQLPKDLVKVAKLGRSASRSQA